MEATLPPDLVSGAYPSAALLNNTATVSAPVGIEINPDDNSASATISTLPFADISLTKSYSPDQPVAGGPVTYTLTVHSDGPGTVDVFAGDLLPAALQKPPTAISITGGTGVCRFDPTGESIGAPPGSGFPIIVCDIPQFGPGEDRVITIQGTLAPDSAGTPVTTSRPRARSCRSRICSWTPTTSKTTAIRRRSRRVPSTSGSRRRGSGAARCQSAARPCSGWWCATTATRRGPASRSATPCPPA